MSRKSAKAEINAEFPANANGTAAESSPAEDALDATATAVMDFIEPHLAPEPDPEDDGGAAQRMLKAIFESARKGRDLAGEYARLNERAKAAKKRWESWQEEHDNLEAGFEREYSGPAGPLFDKIAAEPADAWRSLHITVLDLPTPILDAIGVSVAPDQEHYPTMGQLCDWLAGPPQRTYTDLDDIGPAKAEAIEDAMAAFWAEHGPEAKGSAVGEDGPPLTTAFVEAVGKLAPRQGEGTVTISAAGRSVTITPEDGDRIRSQAKADRI